MNLTQLAQEIHQGNKQRGFYDNPCEIGTMLMLVVSELGEAIEAHRTNKFAAYNQPTKNEHADVFTPAEYFADTLMQDKPDWKFFEKSVKDTFEDEIADAIIRLLDLCGYMKIDIDFHIRSKLLYNETRPKKHGKQY